MMTPEEIKNYINTRKNFDDKFDTLIRQVAEYYKKYRKEYNSGIEKRSLFYINPYELVGNDEIKFYFEYGDCGDIYESFIISIELLCQSDLETGIAKFIEKDEQKRKVEWEEREEKQKEIDEKRVEERDEREYERLKIKFEGK